MSKRKISSSITFHFLAPAILKRRQFLKHFIRELFFQEGIALRDLTYIFCSDPYLAQLNAQYLNHNTLTDIITFPLSEHPELVIGEIYISIDRVRENAQFYQTGFDRELHRVIFHGALHLCGYNDKKNEERKVMRHKEDLYLNQYFVSRETF